MLASDVITSAFVQIGKAPLDGVEPAAWTGRALIELNRMLQHWAAVNLLPMKVTKSIHTLTAGTAIYTVGTGEAISVARPTRIQAASVAFGGNETPCAVHHGMTDYATAPLRDSLWRPRQVFYDPGVTQGLLLLAPIPNGAYSLALWSVSGIPQVTAASDTVVVPLDFEHVVTTAFAAHLMTMWGKSDELLAQKALLAVQGVSAKSAVNPENVLSVLPKVGG